jgi:dTDP-4-amino-4,6-dideoxygalactose transaminase
LIPAAEIPLFKVAMNDGDLDSRVSQVLHSGWVGQGHKVAAFEQALGRRLDNRRVLCLSAGTHGLTLALRLAGVGPGDEVISTALTCTATNMPIIQQGADIVWADVRQDFNIDPLSIKQCITEKTRAIMVVHWGGYSCDMQEISEISADAGGIPVIEDCAHAYGATYQGAAVGSCQYSRYAMFSFQAIKHLTTADGGALCCRIEEDYARGRSLRWFGIDRERHRLRMGSEENIHEWGYKFHMNDVCATIGLCNIPLADDNVNKSNENARHYMQALGNVDGLTFTQTETDRYSSFWLFTMLVEDRESFCRMMASKGIAASRVHERNDKHSCFQMFRRSLHGLDSVVEKMICIPVGWWLSDEEREYIVDCIKGGW